MIDYSKVLSNVVTEIKPSGIRKFFDIAATMDDVISLGVGEPDFQTPWSVRKAGITSLEKGKTKYTDIDYSKMEEVFVLYGRETKGLPEWILEKYLDETKVLIPEIEPILIHCGIEIANREDLKGKRKVITTPCESLAKHGNKLGLNETVFISWKEFLNTLDGKEDLKYKAIDKSPIPLGYFDSLEVKTKKLTGRDNINECFKGNLYFENDIVEMLYCNNGCNNGDGVLINE